MKDMARNTEKLLGIAFADHTATITGAELDMTESKWIAEIIVPIGNVTLGDATNFFTFKVQQAETSGGSYVDADAEQYDVMGSWDLKIDDVADSNTIKSFNFRLKSGYPYLKLVATETLTAQAVFGAVVLNNTIRKPATT